ncbi:GspE/PulE family protein [Burkholderia sp. 3C]
MHSGADFMAYADALLGADPSRLAEVAVCCGIEPIDADALRSAATRFDLLSLHEALALRVLPVERDGTPVMVLADPLSRSVRDELLARFGAPPVRITMSLPGEVERRLAQIESNERSIDSITIDAASGETHAQRPESISLASIARDESPIIRLVNSTLYDALQSRASDIHLESTADGLAIRYRIDGVLQPVRGVPGIDAATQTLSRIKVLAALDIAERRVPQDGRFKVMMQRRDIDFRVSIMPGTHGENAVLRVLDTSQRGDSISLDMLGFDALTARRMRSLAHRPHGLMLITGPTGSGKSTTLYAVLSELNTGEDKIITIEDPVEYPLNGVVQIPVNERKGLTFARGLRSILRHDPDTVMVGEIRDEDTASIAVQSALTGHRVLSTVHANDGFSVIDRFIYMGVEPSTFLEALNGVVSQRLVRRICPGCGDAATDGADLAGAALEVLRREVTPGAGCERCRGTGYHGRIGLAEVLMLDAPMKAALLERSIEKRTRALDACTDFRSMRQAALAAVCARMTTCQEVQRAITLD